GRAGAGHAGVADGAGKKVATPAAKREVVGEMRAAHPDLMRAASVRTGGAGPVQLSIPASQVRGVGVTRAPEEVGCRAPALRLSPVDGAVKPDRRSGESQARLPAVLRRGAGG